VLIIAKQIRAVELIDLSLNMINVKHIRLDGTMSEQERNNYILSVNSSSDTNVVIMTSRLAEHGINLSFVDVVLLLDIELDIFSHLRKLFPTKFNNPLLIYKIITINTVEEALNQRINNMEFNDCLIIKNIGLSKITKREPFYLCKKRSNRNHQQSFTSLFRRYN